MKNILNMYAAVLDGQELPETMQRRILAVASALRDDHVLALLNQVPNLAGDVDAALGKVKGVHTRAAWIRATRRTPDEVRAGLRSERRVAVLAAAASRSDLANDDYLTLAESGNDTVLRTVLFNKAVDGAALRRAAVIWAVGQPASVHRFDQVFSETASVLARAPEVADEVATAATNPAVLTACLRYPLSELAQINVGGGLILPTLATMKELATSYYASQDTRRHISRFVPALVEHLSLPTASDDLRNGVAAMLHKLGPFPTQQWPVAGVNLAHAYQMMLAVAIAPRGEVTSDPLLEASAVFDEERLVALAAQVRDSKSSTQAVALLNNPALPVRAAKMVEHLLERDQRLQLMAEFAAEGHAEMFAVLARTVPHEITDAFLGCFEDPAGLVRATLHAIAQHGRRCGPVLASRWCEPEMLLEIPIGMVNQAPHQPETAAGLSRLLSERLGDAEQVWQMFETLAEDDDVTLDHAIRTALAV
jgi:hypothetical protein